MYPQMKKTCGHTVFSKKQFGFTSGRSTVLQLLQVLDKWTEILDKCDCVDTIYCDFMKAFDKVPHPKTNTQIRKISNNWAI